MEVTSSSAQEDSPRGKVLRGSAYWSAPRRFSFWQKVQILLISQASAWLIYLLGRSLRWEARGDENLEAIYRAGKRAIFTFWHTSIFPATWYWRHRGIIVMTSQNFDGEYVARCIRKHGYGAARGSSSRGGLKALAEMAKRLRQGLDVAFTVDGPRGPRYVAKMGPLLLAKMTGEAVFCFQISLQRKIQLKSWDQSEIPLPFSRALILKAPPIYVPRNADEAIVRGKLQEMQTVLDGMREDGEAHWKAKDSSRNRSSG
jgi:lysophospholipid acyltransferase (LPLAT)-like uncharacterized protein